MYRIKSEVTNNYVKLLYIAIFEREKNPKVIQDIH